MDHLPPFFGDDVEEVRLDIDPIHKPDIVASMTEMGNIGSFDAVYCSHALEHIYPHEAGQALREFLRVLVPGGCAVLIVPDCEGVSPTEDVLFDAPVGPITGLDLYYGFRPLLAAMPHMAHHNAFVQATLAKALAEAGFSHVETRRTGPCHNLIGVAVK
ncbi:MAG: class I SAM-dependent methyltransferase [Gammaproteobacteria bacterium]|nr:class I SAM-dependent methyltransferase [Gammaproteobacteria bacterium]